MAAPMTDERLEELRCQLYGAAARDDYRGAAAELLAEVDRLRGALQATFAAHELAEQKAEANAREAGEYRDEADRLRAFVAAVGDPSNWSCHGSGAEWAGEGDHPVHQAVALLGKSMVGK
jgi:hypothetical protein